MTKTERNTIIARNLRRLMHAKGWTQSDLARETSCHMGEGKSVSRQSVSHIMTSKHAPSEPILLALAAALGVEPVEIDPDPRATWLAIKSAKEAVSAAATAPKPVMVVNADGTADLNISVKVSLDAAMQIMTILRTEAAFA